MFNTTDGYIVIMESDECERLKKLDYEKYKDITHYHRFLGGFGELGPDGVERISEDIAPSFETYCRWTREYKGWSIGKIHKFRPSWKDEFYDNPPEPNIWYEAHEAKTSEHERQREEMKTKLFLRMEINSNKMI